MAGKDKTSRTSRGEATRVLRQFAWNLAGTLAASPNRSGRRGPGDKAGAKP